MKRERTALAYRARRKGLRWCLHGTWTGFPSDYLGMHVEVAVSSDAAESAKANTNFARRMTSGR